MPLRPAELDYSLTMPRDGVLFVGEKGKLISGYYGGNPFRPRSGNSSSELRGFVGGLLLPEDKFRGYQPPAKNLPRCEKADHYLEWTKACKTGVKTTVPIEFGCEMTEVALLGSMALRTRQLIEWDSKTMRVTNSDQINILVNPPYRKGWSL